MIHFQKWIRIMQKNEKIVSNDWDRLENIRFLSKFD